MSSKDGAEAAPRDEEPYNPHGFLASLVDAVLKPGTAHIIRVLVHCAFIALLAILFALFFFVIDREDNVRWHVLALWVLSACLYGSIVWFLSTGIADPPPEGEEEEEEEKKTK